MKRILLLGVLLLPASDSVVFSQIYRAGDYYYASVPEPAVLEHRWETSADVFASSSSVRELSGISPIRAEWGFGARALYALSPWASVGAEGAVSRSQDSDPLVSGYRFVRMGAAIKFTLTPNTTPRTYVLLGAGVTRRKIQYLGMEDIKADSPYLAFGLGVETDLTDGWFIGMEGRAVYDFKRDFGAYFYLKHPWTAALLLRTGCRF